MKALTLLREHFDDPYAEPELKLADRAAWYEQQKLHAEIEMHVRKRRYRRAQDAVKKAYGSQEDVFRDFQGTQYHQIGDKMYMHIVYWRDWLNKTGPAVDALNHAYVTYMRYRQQERIAEHMRNIIDLQRKAVAKKGRQDAAASLDTLRSSAPSVTVDPAKIPQNIVIPGRSNTNKGFANPYFAASERFAGSPFDADLHLTQKALLATIQKALLKHNLKPLTRMYWSRGSYVKFCAFNDDLSVVWRKHQNSNYDAFNRLYFKGHQIETSTFTSTDDAGREKILRSTGMIP